MKGIIISKLMSYNNGVKLNTLKGFSELVDQMYSWHLANMIRISIMRRAI
jgi:hypothetical protein